MSGGSPSLLRQLAALERAVVNLKGHIANLKLLVNKGRRPEVELRIAENWLPDLEAAARTLKILVHKTEQTNRRTGEQGGNT